MHCGQCLRKQKKDESRSKMKRAMSKPDRKTSYQMFEVIHPECLKLQVTVVRGRNISMGWFTDKVIDTPDPYVRVIIPGAVRGKRKTRTFDNNTQPEWNETFTFYLHPQRRPQIVLQLMDANYTNDTEIGHVTMDVADLEVGKIVQKSFTFPHKSMVDFEFLLVYDHQPCLRRGLSLSDGEQEFRFKRSKHVYRAMRKLLGERGPRNMGEVPTIGILGSGGGFRALTAFSGVMKALADSKILDCVSYTAGLSGSSWYLSTLYSHPKFQEPDSTHTVQTELREAVNCNLALTLLSAPKYLKKLRSKKKAGQPVAFTDLFGYLVGNILLKGRTDSRLSDQRSKIEDGTAPLPLYTCVHVKPDVSAQTYHEWLEFTPYEVCMPKYGISMDSKLFGSKFFRGRLVQEYRESPLLYLQGVWGSAFTILMERVFNERKSQTALLNEQHNGAEISEKAITLDEVDGIFESQSEDQVDGVAKSMAALLSSFRTEKGKTTGDDHVVLEQTIENSETTEKSNFLIEMAKGLSDSLSMTHSRRGRAAVVPNFLRGLSFEKSSHVTSSRDVIDHAPPHGQPFTRLDSVLEQDEEGMFVVDAGLAFNLPFPLLLRPQRGVQLYLSFDFSAREEDSANPLESLLLAKKWADLKGLKLPPIDPTAYDPKEGVKTLYIFKDPKDPHCPIILHFVLANTSFKEFKAPGVPRTTPEEKTFADFSLFSDPSSPYGTMNFEYPHLAFDRLSQLAEYNTLLHIDDIKEAIAEVILRRQLQEFKVSAGIRRKIREFRRSLSMPNTWRLGV